MKRILKKLLILFVILFSIFSISCSHEHVWDEGEIIKEANCIESGLKIFHCSCGVTREEVIAITLHTEVIDVAVSATCTVDGKTEGKHCSVCGTITVAPTTVKAFGHTEVIDAAIQVTCTLDGKTEGKHCSVCSKTLVTQTTVKAKGHTEVIDVAKPATCTATGLIAGKHCSVCSATIKEQEKG